MWLFSFHVVYIMLAPAIHCHFHFHFKLHCHCHWCFPFPLPLVIAIATPISTAISIAIPTDIFIAVAIDYLLFNTNLTDYNWKIRKNWRLCASNIASVNAADERVLEIERDTAKTVCSERAVTSAIMSTIKEKQNLQEAQHIEDSDIVLKEVTCLRSAIKSAKRTTAEAICTINYEHNSHSFDEKQ